MLCYYTLVTPGKMEQGNLKITTSLTSLTTQQVLAQPGYILHRDVVDDDDDNNNNNNSMAPERQHLQLFSGLYTHVHMHTQKFRLVQFIQGCQMQHKRTEMNASVRV